MSFGHSSTTYNSAGTCVQARQSDSPEASCDDDGEFEPTQCRRQSDGSYLCFCVRPDGTQVGDAQAVSDPDDAPDCDDLGKQGMRVLDNIITCYSTSVYFILKPRNY